MAKDFKPVVVTANERSNTVLVSAGWKSLERIADLIKQLDVPSGAQHDQRMEVFHLEHADATSAAKVLSGAFDLTNSAIASGSESTTPSRTTDPV